MKISPKMLVDYIYARRALDILAQHGIRPTSMLVEKDVESSDEVLAALLEGGRDVTVNFKGHGWLKLSASKGEEIVSDTSSLIGRTLTRDGYQDWSPDTSKLSLAYEYEPEDSKEDEE